MQAETYREAIECVRGHARVVVHFHPDRIGNRPTTVAEALLEEGIYRNQFETGMSAGDLSAFPGGPRDTWERTLFGGAYHTEDVTDSERPKYGALELVRYSDGPIPRFGSCYLVLQPSVTRRTSFTFAGSEDPRAAEQLGTIDRMENVMAALFAEIERGAMAAPPWPPFRAPTLGVPNLTVARLLEVLGESRSRGETRPSWKLDVCSTPNRSVSARPYRIAAGCGAAGADPAFAGTDTGTTLRKISQRYRFPLRWHCGFRLRVEEVPDDFRGPAMPRLARRIAGADGVLDAAVIGAAETRSNGIRDMA